MRGTIPVEQPALRRPFAPIEGLLLDCLRRVLSGEPAPRPLPAVRWDAFVHLAREEGVLQWFAQSPCLKAVLPSAVVDAARRERIANAQRHLMLSSELLRLLAALREARVDALPFKGVVSAVQLVGDASLRPSGDLDLIVRECDFARARALLMELGYELDAEYADALQRAFWNVRTQTIVDLHWGIPPVRPPFNHSVLWRHRAQVDVLGSHVATFDRDSALGLAAVNCVKNYWNVSLRQVLDVVVPLRSMELEVWTRLRARCRSIRCTRFLLASVRLSEALLPGVLPRPIVVDAQNDPAVAPIVDEILQHLFRRSRRAGPPVFFATRKAYEAALDDRPAARQREHLKRIVMPNARDRAFVPLPRALHFLYFVVRPIRLLLTSIERNPREPSRQRRPANDARTDVADVS